MSISLSPQPGCRPRGRLWLPVALLLCGLWLRAPLLWAASPLDVDEALFATFARQISHENNPLLIGSIVDKPPLAFYITALSFKVFDAPSEWTARLPNLYASLLCLAALWALARRLYDHRLIAALAVLFVALSPLDIAFAGTIFTDPLTTLWVLLACLAITTRRWAWGGALAGLAFATKQSALQFLPLIVILGIIADAGIRRASLGRFAAALLVVAALPFIWGILRLPNSPDWWALGIANNDPRRLIRADEVGPRLSIWLAYLGGSIGGPALLVALAAAGFPLLLVQIKRQPRQRPATIDVVLAAYVAGYLLVYWLVAFNIYERYLHTLIPLVGLLMARTLNGLTHRLRLTRPNIASLLAAGILLAAMGPPALQARDGHSPIRREYERYDGIAAAAAYLNSLPPGTIVYDHWLGWLLGWYTGQQRPPGMWLRITYYPTPEALAADALLQPDPAPRYFVVPDWVWIGPWLRALSQTGFRLYPVAQPGNLTIYRIDPP